MGLTVADVMTKRVRTVAPDMRLVDLQRFLLDEGIGGAPVVESGRLVGIVSRSDVVRQLALERSRAEELSAYYLDPWDADQRRPEDEDDVDEAVAARLHELCVEDAMVHDLIRVSPDAPLEKAARTLLDRGVHRLLVTRDDELVGVVTSSDLVRLVADGRLVSR